MTKHLIILAFSLALTSCGDAGDIKRAIKNRLKDPASAVFDDIIYSKAGDRACVGYIL